MKGTSPYNTVIRDIGYDRFYLHYWTSPEINSYRNYCKKTKIPTISIDATGGLIKKFNLISGRQTGSLFLYQISVMDSKNKTQFSVAHMISERHDNNSITHWLTEWIRNGIVIPKIVVVDGSFALMIAVLKAFTQYSSLNKYIDVCSSLIKTLQDHEEKFFIYFRMCSYQFNILLSKIKNDITKQNTHFREAITATQKFAACLR